MGLKDIKLNESFSQSDANTPKAVSRVEEPCGSSSGGQHRGYNHSSMDEDGMYEGDRTNDSELNDIMIEELLSFEAEQNYAHDGMNGEHGKMLDNDGSAEPFYSRNGFFEPPAMIDIEKFVRDETIKDKDRVRDRRKKDIHNMIERRRRYNINDRIKELGTLLPKTWIEQMKLNKGTILKASCDYLRLLHRDMAKFRKIYDQQRVIKTESQKASTRVWQLEQILKEHGLFPLPEPQTRPPCQIDQTSGKLVKNEPNGPKVISGRHDDTSDTFPPYQPKNVNLSSPSTVAVGKFDPCMGGGQHSWDMGVPQYSSQRSEFLMMDPLSPRGTNNTLISCSASSTYGSATTPISEGVGSEMCTKFNQDYAKSCNEANLSSALFSNEPNSLFS